MNQTQNFEEFFQNRETAAETCIHALLLVALLTFPLFCCLQEQSTMPPRVVGVNEPAGPDVSDFACSKSALSREVDSHRLVTHNDRGGAPTDAGVHFTL